MKIRTLTVIAAALVAALILPLGADAAPLTDAERQRLLDHLERTRKLFLDAVDGLSEAQLTFKAAEDRWSIAECAEHITESESFIRNRIEELLKTPASAEQLAEYEPAEDKVLALITDRSQKFQAPEPLAPDGSQPTADTLKTFETERAATSALAEKAGNLRGFLGPHPAFEYLDAYGWFFFLSGHTERHVLQILEVKEDPGFPKA